MRKFVIFLIYVIVLSFCQNPNQPFIENQFIGLYALNESLQKNASSGEFFEVKNFGTNPGGLKMYIFKPQNISSLAKVIFVLHGCTQSANNMRNAGWENLAREKNAIVIYPEEPSAQFLDDRCFNWFSANDIEKNLGQAESIYSMLKYVKQNFSIDSEKVFILGFSAGGYYASLIATLYPEYFKAFASIAAGPTRCFPDGVNNISEIAKCTSGYGLNLETVSKTANEWGDFIRNTKPNFSNWPRALFIHGSQDTVVKPSLFQEAQKQWENVHGVSNPSVVTTTEFIRSTYSSKKLETWYLINFGHAYPLKNCGTVGSYYIQASICATEVIGNFFLE